LGEYQEGAEERGRGEEGEKIRRREREQASKEAREDSPGGMM